MQEECVLPEAKKDKTFCTDWMQECVNPYDSLASNWGALQYEARMQHDVFPLEAAKYGNTTRRQATIKQKSNNQCLMAKYSNQPPMTDPAEPQLCLSWQQQVWHHKQEKRKQKTINHDREKTKKINTTNQKTTINLWWQHQHGSTMQASNATSKCEKTKREITKAKKNNQPPMELLIKSCRKQLSQPLPSEAQPIVHTWKHCNLLIPHQSCLCWIAGGLRKTCSSGCCIAIYTGSDGN